MDKPYVVGMDIGGTNTVFGIVDARGNILSVDSIKTQAYKEFDEYVTAVAEKLIPMIEAVGGTEKIKGLEKDVEKIGLDKLAEQLGTGVPTLKDIVAELIKPGRDMRDALPKPLLRTDVLDMNDLVAGMELTGTVRNVIDFGAFVDIGVHQDGLVHISQICDKYIKHPSEMLKVGDIVTVWVLSVDVNKKRISLTMKKPKEKTDAKAN